LVGSRSGQESAAIRPKIAARVPQDKIAKEIKGASVSGLTAIRT
jgi:hypothetical protein